MEKINDILNNLKERFSNPLIFSFLCSWLVINWQVTIALLWFNPKQIENEKYQSIFSFINAKVSTDSGLWQPLLFAIGYTLLMPIIRTLIKAFYTWVTKWGETWNLRILKESNISISKYLKLREDHKARTVLLQKVINEEGSYINSLNETKTQLLEAQASINEYAQKLSTSEKVISESQNVDVLNGTWENNHVYEDGTRGREVIYIEHGRYYVINSKGDRELEFDISNFFRSGDFVFFVKEVTSSRKASRDKSTYYNINRLRFEGKELLVGDENGTTKITYTKK